MLIDWMILILGFAGCVGTLMGWQLFFNEERMQRILARYGRDRVRIIVALVYLVFGLMGLYWVISG